MCCLSFPPFQILTLLTDFQETSNEHYVTGIHSEASLKFSVSIKNIVVVTNFYLVCTTQAKPTGYTGLLKYSVLHNNKIK